MEFCDLESSQVTCLLRQNGIQAIMAWLALQLFRLLQSMGGTTGRRQVAEKDYVWDISLL